MSEIRQRVPAQGRNLRRSAGVFHIRLARPGGVPHADREQLFTGRPIYRRRKIPDIGRCRSRCPLIVIRAGGVLSGMGEAHGTRQRLPGT